MISASESEIVSKETIKKYFVTMANIPISLPMTVSEYNLGACVEFAKHLQRQYPAQPIHLYESSITQIHVYGS